MTTDGPYGPLDDDRPTWVYLGNRGAADYQVDEQALADMGPDDIAARGVPYRMAPIPVPKACTRVEIEPGIGLLDAARTIVDPGRIWSRVSTDPAPAWVASSDPGLARLLADHYGCELRDLDLNHGPYVTAGQEG